jgi:hypothetical protein
VTTRREQRRAVRKQLAQLKAEARARVDANPAVQKARRERRARRTLSSAFLLLLLLFLRCDCTGEPAPVDVEPVAEVIDAGVKPKPRVPGKRKPSNDKLASTARPGFEGGKPQSPAWLDDFRMQVAARSPRLALCFKGADRPGALRWNVAVNPESGAVSDHLFEPIGAADLLATQRDCIQKVLSTPGYHVENAEKSSLPTRVSLVIEF